MKQMRVPWCQCTSRNTGWTLDPERGLWVCGKCRREARMARQVRLERAARVTAKPIKKPIKKIPRKR